ncbi:DNA polymerase III subunit chi [Candidatus Profftella armatura (Diaphorina cf. continua)]|uniref:DNA polymerase III subunit chi n=1 Tax=Candidatus Profftella armatura (Diaphorina cf. continua) TaxID=2661583 RepID=A0A7R7ABP0_9PROT|nr:DNA polymerase III subunit chi [Candidatus Profftella armatura (Diaphorina cf. continua)]BCG49563.1 DNA polymerase III subunit chi [Candidatus Profftella armatura (Diaphorina cf. continua)]
MTNIYFHSNISNKLIYTCKLIQELIKKNNIILLNKNFKQQKEFDIALWNFSITDFLPHVNIKNIYANITPIVLITEMDIKNNNIFPHYDTLINASNVIPKNFTNFKKIFEIISTNEIDKIFGRNRYRFYKNNGYFLNHFKNNIN